MSNAIRRAEEHLRALSSSLGLKYEPQDWGIVNADGSRTMELIEFYDSAPDLPCTSKFEMGSLILASANELLLSDPMVEVSRIKDFVLRNCEAFRAHLDYWRSLDDERLYPLGILLRKIPKAKIDR